jgi:hypothetical protein
LCVAVPVTADLINLMTVRSNGFRSHYTGWRAKAILYSLPR